LTKLDVNSVFEALTNYAMKVGILFSKDVEHQVTLRKCYYTTVIIIPIIHNFVLLHMWRFSAFFH